MTGQNPDDPLAESAAEEDELFQDAVEMNELEDPNDIGGVEAELGEVIDVVDGVEIRNLADERDLVLPIEDGSGALIGGDSFPETNGGVL
jgi:hypothetical protein